MNTIVLVLIILVSLVVIHEFGHFVAAKFFGVRVDEFGVGYPPRAFSFGRWGDTEYTLNWLPFGGFVRLWGEEEVGKTDDPRGFTQSARYKQIIILVAGIFMNIFAAWALFTMALHMGVAREVDAHADARERAGAQLMVTEVYPASPAAVANIKPGDVIISITDQKGMTLATPSADDLIAFVRSHPGKQLSIEFVHAGATTTAMVIPVNAVIPNAPAQPALGIGVQLETTTSLPWAAAAQLAMRNTMSAFVTIAHELSALVWQFVRGDFDVSDLVGPVGLVGVAHDAARNGVGTIFALAAFISINLAIINSMPIPALDGGRIVIVCIEAIIRRRLPILITHVVTMIGVACIVGLMLVVTYHDVVRLLT